MGPTSPEHGELAELAWKHDERMNRYKMVIHIQGVKCSECVLDCGGVVCLNLLRDMIEIGCDPNHLEREKIVVWLQV